MRQVDDKFADLQQRGMSIEFENVCESLCDGTERRRWTGLDFRFQPLTTHRPNLVDDCDCRLSLACHRNADWRMWAGGSRKWNYDHRLSRAIEDIRSQHQTRPRLLDFRALSRVEADPPDIASKNRRHASTVSRTGSSKDCQSAMSRLSLASRLAARHAAVNSWRRSSARRSRATVLERRCAGVFEKNFFARGAGMSKVTCT